MKGKAKSGISLIVLVITIIVIIILATAVIVSISKNNPIEEANTARYTSDVASMQSVLTMTVSKIAAEKKCNVKVKEGYVNSVKTGVKETEGTVNIEFENAVDGAQNATVKFGKGKNENNTYYTGKLLPVYPSGETSWYVDKNGTLALKVGKNSYNDDKVEMPPTEYKELIPKGATYYKGVTSDKVGVYENFGAKYTEGQPFPNIEQGDVYVYGDYEYRYMQEWGYNQGVKCWINSSNDGWGVKVLNNKETYGEILGNINKKNIVSLDYTFYGCSKLKEAQVIPSTVTSLTSTFSGCSALTNPPAIPEGVTDMYATFEGCSTLTEAPVIPEGVTDMGWTFSRCKELTKAPLIPSNVTKMDTTFGDCWKLTEAPNIPEGVTNMGSTFMQCLSLTHAPAIPSTVTNMFWAFYGCSELTEAPEIPEKVTNLGKAFYGCSKLKGTVTVNANPKDYIQCFFYCSDLTLTGTSTKLKELATTGTNIRVVVP